MVNRGEVLVTLSVHHAFDIKKQRGLDGVSLRILSSSPTSLRWIAPADREVENERAHDSVNLPLESFIQPPMATMGRPGV